LNISPSVNHDLLETRTLTNNGIVNYSPTGASGYYFYLNGTGTTFNNAGTFNYTGSASNDWGLQNFGTNTVINNTGTFQKTSGASTSAINVDMNNKATIAVSAGKLQF